MWRDIVPPLSEHHDVHAPTLLEHRGRPAIQRRPVSVSDIVDATERYLDERGLARPHLVGNSLGGWVAVELARRACIRKTVAPHTMPTTIQGRKP